MADSRPFAEKKIMLASWGCEEKDHYQRLEWLPYFREAFGSVAVFSPRTSYFRYGKDEMNRQFLEVIQKEQPDYLVLSLNYDEFYPETLKKIRQVSPKTLVMGFFGDDEWRFDDWARHYALFMDYKWLAEENFQEYKKDCLKNAVHLHGSSSRIFKPLNLEKRYDVTFIGGPIADRPDYIKFLKENSINIKVFGRGWDKYPELKDIYLGYLEQDDYIKALNQSKINLSFSKGMLPGSKGGQFKGRVIECALCKAFVLVERTGRNVGIFRKNKKLTFQDKHELLERISYFLKNKKEREKLAEQAYHEFIRKYTWETRFTSFFNSIKNAKPQKLALPETKKKIIHLLAKDLADKNLQQRIKNADYIAFDSEDSINSPDRDYFQAYSLEKSGKDISCCDYYAYSKSLGNYLLFMAKKAFYTIDRKNFCSLLHPSQLMLSKRFFVKNLKSIKHSVNSNLFDFISDKNTIFVSMPLVQIKNSRQADYACMKKSFRMLFLDKLYSIIRSRKFYSPYPLMLLAKSLLGKDRFILQYIKEALFSRENWLRLRTSFS